jgi:hypothetical protein
LALYHHARGEIMGLVVFLAVVGALTIYAFHTLFDAAGWGFLVALILFVLGMNAAHRPQADEPKGSGQFPVRDKAWAEPMLAMRGFAVAMTACLALVAGIGVGWLSWGRSTYEMPTSSFMKMQNGRLLAAGPLSAALEAVPSGGAPVSLEGPQEAQFRAKMTFQNASRDYCRHYELVPSDRVRVAGIACRIPGGNWSVVLQSLLPPSVSGAIVPAGSQHNAALDAALGALIDGDPLIGKEEAAIMRNGWRK